MNIWLIIAVIVCYPLFGFGIYWVRNNVETIKDYNKLIFIPIGLSFIVGIGFLIYAMFQI